MRSVQAFNDNDLETTKEFFREDVVWRVPGRSPIAGEYHGLDEVGTFLQQVRDLTSEATIEPDVILADDRSVMVHARVSGKREGKRYDNDQAYLCRLDDEGKVFEVRVIPVDLYAYDEFWS